MYTGPKLLELLASKHQQQNTSELYKQEIFTLEWRAKVGSFPHPDLETLISAGEPCGAWKPEQGRPEDKRNVGENWRDLQELPLYGYIPGSSIRGLVRAWAEKRPEIRDRMRELLGKQENDNITAGKIEFLDAWPRKAAKLTLDIVNPQQDFQVFHRGQSTPVSSYTLGDGQEEIEIIVAIRGIPNQTTPEEVAEVWDWIKQALGFYGVGSRTASGYGSFKDSKVKVRPEPDYRTKNLIFTLYSQGSSGPDMRTMELRPSHWRGWLRSWLLRFFLGVMNQNNAETTVNELLGTLEPDTQKGLVRLQVTKGNSWGEESENKPDFYCWKGQVRISAPTEILNKVILPVVKFAASLGGVGRGWRRPLHIFTMNNGNKAARGTYLHLKHTVKNQETNAEETKNFALIPNRVEVWQNTYRVWLEFVQQKWPNRISLNSNQNLASEVFSPQTCVVYLVPGPVREPIDQQDMSWLISNPTDTRGDGMNLIYQNQYKRKIDVGGNAGNGGAYCSWVSIKRIKFPNREQNTACSEVVCVFKGGNNSLRNQFIQDVSSIAGAARVFGS
jgi:CRISPR-associated protein Cmr6